MIDFPEWLEAQRDPDSDYHYPEFIYGADPGDEYQIIEQKHVDSRRWYEVYQVVMKHRTEDEYWAFHLSDPSTEMQEFYWDECIDKPYKVVPKEVTTVVYERA